MRTLLIDNYDSYTYNLFQLLAQVDGAEPDVMTNDVADLDLNQYDAIVISPGPGHPSRARDFGICADVLAMATVPILGVCLGHQGLALSEGGRVIPAPTPRHGHVSRIRHNEDLLFDGIPTEFSAVRYHSLAVAEPLPESLAAIAWSEDGVLMGIRHRRLPRWGVQFHPESIETAHGIQLLRNFTRVAKHPGMSTAFSSEIAGDHPKTDNRRRFRPNTPPVSAVVRSLGEVDTEQVAQALEVDFWLDSSRVEPGLSRFSYLGRASERTISYRVGESESVFHQLKRELASTVIEAPEVPFDFVGGWVGYFGYELKADCVKTRDAPQVNRHRAEQPDAVWAFVDRFVVVDHLEHRTYVVALANSSADAWLDETAALLASLPPGPPPLSAPPPVAVQPQLVRERDSYIDDIAACQQYLRAGESYEINLTNAVRVAATESGFETYRRLRRLNPAPYAAYLRMGGIEIACSSPERFLRITPESDRVTERGLPSDRVIVDAKPIKGTAPRGVTPAKDAELCRRLAGDRKTRAENLMIVDLIRNDLGRVCTIGSVRVPVLMAVESYETMHQLVSTVRGELRPDHDVIDCVRACFPAGSMTGAPKLRTMEIIDTMENHSRGVYSGAIGFLGCPTTRNPTGTADLNVVIRTMVLHDGTWHLGAGGAIVLDSDPAAEYEEMLLKVDAPLRAVMGALPLPEGEMSHIH